MTTCIRIPLLALLGLTVLGLALPAAAEDGPPAEETTGGATRETPPDTGWSPPAVTPGRTPRAAPSDPSLPPPRIVRRRTGSAPAGRTASSAMPSSGMPASSQPRVPASPGAASPMPPPATGMPPSTGRGPIAVTPRTPRVPATPRAPVQPRAAMPASRTATSAPATTAATPTGIASCRIFGISKLHNVPLDRGPGTENDLALQIDVDYELRGQARRDVYVAIWFARTADGSLVSSAVDAYKDRAGNATLQTRSARVVTDPARYKATLRIPYRAFPMAVGEASYDVEARVQVLRTEPSGQVTVLCRGSTTFTVFGYDEGESPAAAAPESGFPEAAAPPAAPPANAGDNQPGAAIPGEDGTIED